MYQLRSWAVYKQHQHQVCPKSHHIQFHRHCSCRFQLFPLSGHQLGPTHSWATHHHRYSLQKTISGWEVIKINTLCLTAVRYDSRAHVSHVTGTLKRSNGVTTIGVDVTVMCCSVALINIWKCIRSINDTSGLIGGHVNIPEQLKPSPSNPLRQKQSKLPMVLLHLALSSQTLVSLHSLISVKSEKLKRDDRSTKIHNFNT